MPMIAPGIASTAVSRCVSSWPGIVPPLTMTPKMNAPNSAPRNAPTIPPQKRSGRKIVKCQMASPIITHANAAISGPLRTSDADPTDARRPCVRPRSGPCLGHCALPASFAGTAIAGSDSTPDARSDPLAPPVPLVARAPRLLGLVGLGHDDLVGIEVAGAILEIAAAAPACRGGRRLGL